MRCTRCDAGARLDDSYCRKCGASLRIQRLPVSRSRTLPVPWRGALPTVARGAAALAAGAVGQYVLRSLIRRALSPASPRRRLPAKALPARGELIPEGGFAVSETVVMRRVTLRR
ncbi:MAG: hypothetical protein HYS09_03700 [Chloroflexi bacterium]|nr:hypothetical protein [Chloroflexota bacterium]